MRVRSMSLTANSVIAATRAPGVLSRRRITDVRSAPVRGGGGPGGAASTNRVRAFGSSTTSAARTSSSQRCAASAVETPASARPPATSWAAPALELAGTTVADGRCSASQWRTWAAATGNAATVETLSMPTPGRTTMLNATSSVCSA